MSELPVFLAWVVLASALFAEVEVQIEGKNGWAASLPTWRVSNRLTRFVLGAKPLTGYHLFIFLFVLALSHLPWVIVPGAFTIAAELKILSFIVAFWTLEDFLWFCLNPAFGLRRFRPSEIWWHADGWWWVMPRDYWFALPAAAGLYWLGARVG